MAVPFRSTLYHLDALDRPSEYRESNVSVRSSMGKNKDEVLNGAYETSHGDALYVKFSPEKNEHEAVAELLFSNCIQMMVRYKLLQASLRDTMVEARGVQSGDGRLGVATPLIQGEELTKTLDTDFMGDRSPMYEAFYGDKTHQEKLGAHVDDLALSQMLRLLFADGSGHSGNFFKNHDDKVLSFDHGAAFRYLGDERNNSNLDAPVEAYNAWYKFVFKRYHRNFDKIPQFKEKVEQYAQVLDDDMRRKNITFQMIVAEAWDSMPDLYKKEDVLPKFGFNPSNVSGSGDAVPVVRTSSLSASRIGGVMNPCLNQRLTTLQSYSKKSLSRSAACLWWEAPKRKKAASLIALPLAPVIFIVGLLMRAAVGCFFSIRNGGRAVARSFAATAPAA